MKYIYDYPRMTVTVDVLVFRRNIEQTEILLIKRGKEPFKNKWAFPGGFVDIDEKIIDAAKRELKEETNIELMDSNLVFLNYYDDIDRDPRHRTITFAFYSVFKNLNSNQKAGDDAADAKWFHINNLPELAFDHSKIINEAINIIQTV